MKKDNFINYISRLAIKAMLYEVSASPKPGLVDRFNSGAHKDMNFYTFIDSSLALIEYFKNCAKVGFRSNADNLLDNLRPIGINAEEQMLQATNGVNTHKGLIFSLGIISAVACSIFKSNKSIYIDSKVISDNIKKVTSGITEELQNNSDDFTYGRKIYLLYGFKGVRGEVESGFKTVIDISLPLFKRYINENIHNINDIMIECLLHLMANLDDTNILGRRGIETLHYVKRQANDVIKEGGYLTKRGKSMVLKMDKDFIEKNISPGGSADLLAVTLLLYFLENGDRLNGNILSDIGV